MDINPNEDKSKLHYQLCISMPLLLLVVYVIDHFMLSSANNIFVISLSQHLSNQCFKLTVLHKTDSPLCCLLALLPRLLHSSIKPFVMTQLIQASSSSAYVVPLNNRFKWILAAYFNKNLWFLIPYSQTSTRRGRLKNYVQDIWRMNGEIF